MSDGLEMVLRVHTFPSILALPSISIGDQVLVPEHLWDDCPKHNFRPNEIPKLTLIAKHLEITLDEMEKMIEDGDVESIENAAKLLGISLD